MNDDVEWARRLGKAQIDALFERIEGHPRDDRTFLSLLSASLSAFESVGCEAQLVAEIWEHAFAAYHRACLTHDPDSSPEENRALMRSLRNKGNRTPTPARTVARASCRSQARYTVRQGQYLAFIQRYITMKGIPPAQQDIAEHFLTSAPSVHQMIVTLEKRGLISRVPGEARSIRVLLSPEELTDLGSSHDAQGVRAVSTVIQRHAAIRSPKSEQAAPVRLYTLEVYLTGGPMTEAFCKKNRVVLRKIEIRGDQTLADLHSAIFDAFNREEEHAYQFQFGKRPNDPKGPNYGHKEAQAATLDGLGLKDDRVFGYWFDFGDDWFHQIQIKAIGKAIPTVAYPRVIRRIGQSPPQYSCEE